MIKKSKSKIHDCKYSEKTWLLVVVGISIVFSLLTTIAVAYIGHKSFNNAVLTTVSKTTSIGTPQNDNIIKVTNENTFVEYITGFYETVITIFSVIIGFVLAIGFIYLRNVSKSEVRDAVREETDADFFKSYLKEHLKNVFKADTKDGILGAFIEDQDEIVETMKEKYETIEKIKSEIKELKDSVVALQGTITINNNQSAQTSGIEKIKSEIKELKDTVVALQGTIETSTNNNTLTQPDNQGARR